MPDPQPQESKPLPSMDAILAGGRARDRRLERALGAILLLGGLAFVIGSRDLTGGALRVSSYGAIGAGVVLLGRGFFGRA